MSCRVEKTADGASLILCGRAAPPRPAPCSQCRAPSHLLCDFVKAYTVSGICLVPQTCSRPLCAKCADEVGPNRHHCKLHKRVGEREATP